MRRCIADIVTDVVNAPNDDTKITILRQNDHPMFRVFLRMMFDDTIKWALPEDAPPYTPNPYLDQEGMFYAEIKRLYLFMEGGNPNLSQLKRESLFINVLESIHPRDAQLLLNIKDRKRPEGITPTIVNQAFPGLI